MNFSIIISLKLSSQRTRKEVYLRAENVVVVAMAFDKNVVSARQSAFPLLITRNAFLETFLPAPVLLFASLLHPSAFFLALIVFMIRIFLDVTLQRAGVTAIQSHIAR